MGKLKAILLQALAAQYKRETGHPDDTSLLAEFIDRSADKKAIELAVQSASVELTPDQIFQLIDALQDAKYYRDKYEQSRADLNTWADAWQKFRDEVQTPDGRDKRQRIYSAALKYFGGKLYDRKQRDTKAAIREYDFLTTDVAHAHGNAMSHADVMDIITEQFGWPSTDATRKALTRAGWKSKAGK